MQLSLIFLCDIVNLKPTIVLIIDHFLTSVKFREIPRQYQNSGKLWTLLINSGHPSPNCTQNDYTILQNQKKSIITPIHRHCHNDLS